MDETPPETPKKLGGRPKKGSVADEKLLEICARVAVGETLTSIAKEAGMPSPAAFRSAIYARAEMREVWEHAKAERPHSLFEQAIDLARELKAGDWTNQDTNRVRAITAAIDTLRVAAARLAPREYGERQTGPVVVPVQINTTLSLVPGQIRQTRASVYQITAEPQAD